jgi:hypothetical protein
MNQDQLREYKIQKSRLFNAKMRDLRLKEKENKKIADQQPDNTIDQQPDELTLQDVMDIFSTLDTKMDIIQTKLETIMENKLYETLDNKLDLIDNKLETIIENKLETKLETEQPINRQPSIFFA